MVALGQWLVRPQQSALGLPCRFRAHHRGIQPVGLPVEPHLVDLTVRGLVGREPARVHRVGVPKQHLGSTLRGEPWPHSEGFPLVLFAEQRLIPRREPVHLVLDVAELRPFAEHGAQRAVAPRHRALLLAVCHDRDPEGGERLAPQHGGIGPRLGTGDDVGDGRTTVVDLQRGPVDLPRRGKRSRDGAQSDDERELTLPARPR